MDEFVEKLIERLGEAFHDVNPYVERVVVKIVNQLAEEHKDDIQTIDVSELLGEQVNDGWIPVEQKLPEEEGYYLITVLFYHLHHPTVMGCHFEDGEWWQIDKEDKVLAWRELPAPYQPKGE